MASNPQPGLVARDSNLNPYDITPNTGDLADMPATHLPAAGAVRAALVGLGGGSGVTRNTHAHDTAGTLAIPRAAADQDTVVTITANVDAWTHGLTTDRDHLSGRIQGASTATESYTVELDGVFDSITQAGATALDFGMFSIHADTIIEFSLVRNDDRYDLIYNVLKVGTAPVPDFVTWTDGSTRTGQGTWATGDQAVFGAGNNTGSGGSDFAWTAEAFPSNPVIRLNHAATTVDAAAARANNSYIEFPLTGTDIDAAEVRFQMARGGSSTPRGWELRSSADNYASSLGTGTVATESPTLDTEQVIDVSALPATTDLAFRLYFYTPAVGAVLYLDNFTVEAV